MRDRLEHCLLKPLRPQELAERAEKKEHDQKHRRRTEDEDGNSRQQPHERQRRPSRQP
jgi:hypothetical protein